MAIELSKHVSSGAAKKLWNQLMSKERKIEKVEDAAEETGRMLFGHLVGGAGGYAVGYMEGKYGGIEYEGVPAPLGLALLADGASFLLTKPGGYGRFMMQEVGKVGLTCYAHTLGRAAGEESKKTTDTKK